MKASEIAKRFGMKVHEENGLFVETHYKHSGEGRPLSGSIYYYVNPGERTEFHRIDCDEYWIYNAGSTLELWVIDPEGNFQIKKCGITEDAQPNIYIAKGSIFGSRQVSDQYDGTLVTAITVPRFKYEGFELFTKEEIVKKYPVLADFWK